MARQLAEAKHQDTLHGQTSLPLRRLQHVIERGSLQRSCRCASTGVARWRDAVPTHNIDRLRQVRHTSLSPSPTEPGSLRPPQRVCPPSSSHRKAVRFKTARYQIFESSPAIRPGVDSRRDKMTWTDALLVQGTQCRASGRECAWLPEASKIRD